MKTKFKDFLLTEMPQYFQGQFVYQKESKFRDISKKNIENMNIIGHDERFVYVVSENTEFGYIFEGEDFDNKYKFVKPILTLAFRKLDIGYQVHKLRIQERFARQSITTAFYDMFIEEFGSIVSDHTHLEGGKVLWRSFIDDPNRSVSLYDTNKNEIVMEEIPENISDDEIWSTDESKKNLILIMKQK